MPTQTRDELLAALNLGWETARRPWRLLAPEHRNAFRLESIGTSGRDLDQLAYDLRRLGYEQPARLAYSVAFVLNGLIGQSIQFDHDLADKTSQIVAIMAEMLLELEATDRITTAEPTELVEHLKAVWGLVIHADNHSASRLPRPHFRPRLDGTNPPTEQILQGLTAVSDQMVHATESLMQRITRIADFPYSAALTRILHLATTIRDQLAGKSHHVIESGLTNSTSPATETKESELIELSIQQPSDSGEDDRVTAASSPIDTIDRPSYPFDAVEDKVRPHFVGNQTPYVLVIDESPFFRMLLTSAIESCGYSIHSVSTLQEANAACGEVRWSLVIWGGAETAQGVERLRDWL